MKRSPFEYFMLNGIEYYRHMGNCYEDNGTIRNVITDEAYRFYLMEYFIKEANT